MIYIVSEVSAVPGSRDQIIEEFRKLVPLVLQEDGCLGYTGTCDAEDAPRFRKDNGADKLIILEQWRDMAAFKAHVRAPHMAAYGEKVNHLIAGRAVSVLSAV